MLWQYLDPKVTDSSMGGKRGQAQRVKNNERPSSSSRSAEKLGTNIPGFVGFSANQDGGYTTVLPGFTTKENLDTNIDSDVQLLFRKMSKKDSTTKLKALNEFKKLLDCSDEEYAINVVSLWPRIYCQLSMDYNHRVREATQIAHNTLVSKCGRSIAPYLKQMIPVWLMSQFDTYAAAKSQAKEAFDNVFPENKVPEVLAHCRNEIFSYICDNLIVQTPSSFSNPKLYTTEECESIYERAIITSLQTYEFYLSHLPEIHFTWLCEVQTKLFNSNKFWALAHHKSPLIRSYTYSVIGCLARKLPEYYQKNYVKKASDTIFNKLSQSDSDVIVSLIENSILLIAYSDDDCINYKDKIFPNIYNILSTGGYNNASFIGPLLLPLLIQLSKLRKDDITFYDEFLASLAKGFTEKNVIMSKSGYEKWLTGFIKCLEFVASQCVLDDTKKSLLISVISKAMRSWLQTVLSIKKFNTSFDYIKLNVVCLSKMLLSWTKTSEINIKYSQLVRIFWQNLQYLIVEPLESKTYEEDELCKITSIHVKLLTQLKLVDNNKYASKDSLRVKFDVPQDNNLPVPNSGLEVETFNIEKVDKCYIHDLSKVVNSVCAQYLVYAKTNNSTMMFNPIYLLVQEFDSVHLHEALLLALDTHEKSVKYLYMNYYINWLKGSDLRSQFLVNLTFVLLQHLLHEDQICILDSFNQFPPSVLKWCISESLLQPYRNIPAVNTWLKSNLAHDTLVHFCKLIIKEGDKYCVELLKKCFIKYDNESAHISKSSCNEIISIITTSLYNYDSIHLNMCSEFALYILSSSSCETDGDCESYCKLSLGLFSLVCNFEKDKCCIDGDDFDEINSSWQNFVSTLTVQHLTYFVNNAMTIIHNKLQENENMETRLQTIEKLSDLSYCLYLSIYKSKLLSDKDNILTENTFLLLQNDTDSLNTTIDKVKIFSFISDISTRKFTSVVIKDDQSVRQILESCFNDCNINLNLEELTVFLSWMLFCVKYIEKLMTEEEYLTPSLCEKMEKPLSNLIHNVTFIKTFHSNYKMMDWYETVNKFYEPIETTLRNIITKMSNELYTVLHDELKHLAANEGFYWSTSFYFCEYRLRLLEDKQNTTDDINKTFQNILSKFNQNLNVEECFMEENFSETQLIGNTDIISDYNETVFKTIGLLTLKNVYQNYFSSQQNKFKSCLNGSKDSPNYFLNILVDLYNIDKNIILSDIDLCEQKWNFILCNVSIVRYLVLCVNKMGHDLQSAEWDFITITLVTLLQSVDKSKEHWNMFKVSALGCAVLDLYCAVKDFVSSLLFDGIREELKENIIQVFDEWKEFVSPGVHSYIIDLFIKITNESIQSKTQLLPACTFFVNSLQESLQRFEWKQLETFENDNVRSITNVVKLSLEILGSPCHHLLKYLSSVLLKSLTPLLISHDKNDSDKGTSIEIDENKTEVPESEKSKAFSVHMIEPTLLQLQGCVETILMPYKICEDHCILIPYTDSYSITLGYLLLWEVLLDISQESTAYLQHQYSEFFRQGQFVDSLLNTLFHLLPEELIQSSNISLTSDFFKSPPLLTYSEAITPKLISHLSCHRLFRCLQGGWLGVLVRGWWGSLPTKSSQHVEYIIKTHVSPLLIADQLSMVSKKQKRIPNIEITIHPSVNEIVCIYVIEDLKMGLTIQLCGNHPLNKPLVVSSGTPLNNMTWLSMYLSHQNGSVYQAVRMWANAVQKKVESTPVCYVCYCRLHPNNGQLPKMLCQTCKNKFHNVCLYKWFSTSGKATCPMCRNVFNI